jgi:hypothetical protein
MSAAEITTSLLKLNYAIAARGLSTAASRLAAELKYNPYWYLQPRVPAGDRHGGRWMPGGPLVPAAVLDPLRRGTAILVREVGKRVAPELRRLPERWKSLDPLPLDNDFLELQGRLGPPSPRRPGSKAMRFRTEDELRRYLGPAGPGREWHHIVEKRLALILFAAELIHSTDNIINLPVDLHRHINARMSSRGDDTEMIVRRFYMNRLSFRDQYNYGVDTIVESAGKLGYDPNRL